MRLPDDLRAELDAALRLGYVYGLRTAAAAGAQSDVEEAVAWVILAPLAQEPRLADALGVLRQQWAREQRAETPARLLPVLRAGRVPGWRRAMQRAVTRYKRASRPPRAA